MSFQRRSAPPIYRLAKPRYFRDLLATNTDLDGGVRPLLRVCRENIVRLQKTDKALVRSLEHDSLLRERVERLISLWVPWLEAIVAAAKSLKDATSKKRSAIRVEASGQLFD